MSAIFGYNDLKEEHLLAQYESVKHRGDTFIDGSMNGMHFGVAKMKKKAHNSDVSSGISIEKDTMVAIAGHVLNDSAQSQSPQNILRAFQKHGLEFLKTMDGSFVMAIQQNQHTYLIRDPTGLRTLCYSVQNGNLSFCIEGKGIYVLPSFQRNLNLTGLFQYFTYSFMPLQHTMMEDVFEIPAGTAIEYDGSTRKITEHRYFQVEKFPKHDNHDIEYWESRIRSEVDQVISDKLSYHEDVGVFLSGGLDSSLIAARVAKLHNRRIHTFSIHFGKKYPNENEFAKLVADRYKTIHHEVEIKPKSFVPNLWETIRFLDDPIGDPITIPNFELSKVAVGQVSAIFNGEGGDPCFGGPKNIPMLLGHWYGGKRSENHFEKAYLNSYKRGYQYLQQIISPDLLELFNPEEHLESIITPFLKLEGLGFLDKLMVINMRLKGAHLILPKVERMLGANGFFPYSPLFSKKLVQSSMEMPSKLKLNAGIEKYILKRAFRDDLPLEIINRPKSGMRVPVRYWFQGEMKKYVHDLLTSSDVKNAGIFNTAKVKELLSYNTESGLQRHGLLIWMMMTLEIWRQIFIEKKH